MALSLDLLRKIASGLALWDAKSLQNALPSCAVVVSELVERAVAEATTVPCPRMLVKFLKAPPAFQELVRDNFVLLRTPIPDATIQRSFDGITVVLFRNRHHARVEIRTAHTAAWPTFLTLVRVLETLWWYARALEAVRVPHAVFRTRAERHRPVTEVLNDVASRFVKECIVPAMCGLTISEV